MEEVLRAMRRLGPLGLGVVGALAALNIALIAYQLSGSFDDLAQPPIAEQLGRVDSDELDRVRGLLRQ